MNYTYKIYFSVLTDVPANQQKEREMIITAISPIRALDIFHKNIQTMAPKFKPEDYKITSLVQRYTNETRVVQWIEAAIDLPNSPNPTIGVKPVYHPLAQSEMPLDDARTPAQKRSHEEAGS